LGRGGIRPPPPPPPHLVWLPPPGAPLRSAVGEGIPTSSPPSTSLHPCSPIHCPYCWARLLYTATVCKRCKGAVAPHSNSTIDCMACFKLHLACRASPSDLCKPDLAKPIPVSIFLSRCVRQYTPPRGHSRVTSIPTRRLRRQRRLGVSSPASAKTPIRRPQPA